MRNDESKHPSFVFQIHQFSIWPIMAIGYARFLEGLSGNRKACF